MLYFQGSSGWHGPWLSLSAAITQVLAHWTVSPRAAEALCMAGICPDPSAPYLQAARPRCPHWSPAAADDVRHLAAPKPLADSGTWRVVGPQFLCCKSAAVAFMLPCYQLDHFKTLGFWKRLAIIPLGWEPASMGYHHPLSVTSQDLWPQASDCRSERVLEHPHSL